MPSLDKEKLEVLLRKYLFKSLKRVGRRPGQVQRNLEYGNLPAQKLDIYLSKNQKHNLQLVFFHGGSWNSGNKNEYAFIGNALANLGVACAVVGYRLYPQVRFPAFVEDGAQALAWLQRNGQQHGFGGEGTFLMGHSAGAHIAFLLGLDERYHGPAGLDAKRIKGLIGLGGVYRFRPENDPEHSDIFAVAGPGFDAAKPIHFVGAGKAPLLLLHGSKDGTVRPYTAERMLEAAQQAGQQVELHMQPGYGHIRPLFDFVPFMPNHQKTMNLLLQFMTSHQD